MTSGSDSGGGSLPLEERPALVDRVGRWLARSQREADPYEVTVLSHQLVVLPGVFSPKYYSETAFYARHVVARLSPGSRYLDVGCGAGLTAVLAAKRGASVVAIDVNPAAVENTRQNCVRHGVTSAVDVRCSDVLSAIAHDEQFDVIFWNIPFAYREPGTRLTMIEEAVYDPGYRKHIAFLDAAPQHVSTGGEVLLGLSESLGDLRAIRELADARGLQLSLLASTLEDGTPEPTVLQLLSARVHL